MVGIINNMGSFFSDYYISEFLNKNHKGKLGENSKAAAYRSLLRTWQRAYKNLGSSIEYSKTKQLWLEPLLQQLGFSNLDDGPELHEVYGNREVTASPKCAFRQDKKQPYILFIDIFRWGQDLDSPIPAEARKLTPHKKMERMLDLGDARFGMITNGRQIRLLRKEQVSAGRHYFEVDLEELFEQQSETDFAIFWALFRQDAFVMEDEGKCLIDRIQEGSGKFSTKVSEDLRDSVRIAIESFIRGIVEEPKNKERLKDLSAKQLFEQGLVFMYRMLFVLYAESRNLLPREDKLYRENYSLESLRDLVDVHHKEEFAANQYRFWKSLKALFKMINEGVDAGELVVPGFNGGLFSERMAPLLEKIVVPDSIMFTVIDVLSKTEPQKHVGRERIAYHELGVEELGSVYEGLLKYEPKIAKEEMLIVKIGGQDQIIASSFLTRQTDSKFEVLEKIIPGTFYLSTWSGGRKQSATYYTPKKITEWLVKQALEPLIKERTSDEILNMKVLDPAMGSGAFLVATCHYLADEYANALVAEGREMQERIDDELKAEFRRMIAERCLYGVDVNPMAVELAKVSMWLTTVAKGKPLTFLDHHLRCGDSLNGARLDNLGEYPIQLLRGKKSGKIAADPKQLVFDDYGFKQGISAIAQNYLLLIEKPPENIEDIKKKEMLFESDKGKDSFYLKLKYALDLYCALWFWEYGNVNSENFSVPSISEYREILSIILGSNKVHNETEEKILNRVKAISKQLRFFHWELEFPEVFYDEAGNQLAEPGFDLVVGNPPWEIVKPNAKEFFKAYDPAFSKKLPKQEAIKRIKSLCEDERIHNAWQVYKKSIEIKSRFYRLSNNFEYLGKGDINSYKLFLELFYKRTKNGGKIAITVPSGLGTDEGSGDLRKLLLNQTKIDAWLMFENKNKIFPIHSGAKFLLLVAEKGNQTERLPCAFYLKHLDALDTIGKSIIFISSKMIKKFSPQSLSIMEFRDPQDLIVSAKIYDEHPLLSDFIPNTWNVHPSRELDRTNDSDLFNNVSKGWPLYEGKMFYQFRNDLAKPEYWVDEKRGLQRLRERYLRLRKSNDKTTNKNLNSDSSRDFDNMPQMDFRLAFRTITHSSTNERTMIASILPPKIFIANSAAVIYLKEKDQKKKNKENRIPKNLAYDQATYLCALLNSFIIDYILRQKVTVNVNFFIVEQLPIPRLDRNHILFREIVKKGARLIASSEEYRKFANELDVECGPLNASQRKRIIAEINAIIVKLYEIDREDLQHILSSFPLVDSEEKELTLECFRELFLPQTQN